MPQPSFRALKPSNEPPRGKTNNLHRRKQRRRSASLISAFVFATRIVQFLFYLNPKFQASSSFLCLYSPVCVGPVRKPHCWFSHEAGQIIRLLPQLWQSHSVLKVWLNLSCLCLRHHQSLCSGLDCQTEQDLGAMELLVLLEVGSTLNLRIYGFGTNNVSEHNVPGGISEACSGMHFLLPLYTFSAVQI